MTMDELRPYLLDAREDYPEPYYMLEFNGVPFSALGGIQALTGQKKNGKTFVIAMLIATCLAPDSPRVHDNLPGADGATAHARQTRPSAASAVG